MRRGVPAAGACLLATSSPEKRKALGPTQAVPSASYVVPAITFFTSVFLATNSSLPAGSLLRKVSKSFTCGARAQRRAGCRSAGAQRHP
jgi:hypothetical protein